MADGDEKRSYNNISQLTQDEVDELIEEFVLEKGWFVPAIHEKYLKVE